MRTTISVKTERFPIAGSFTIARGSKTEATAVVCTLSAGGATGLGECVPYQRYDETPESVVAQIEAARPNIENGITRQELLGVMPAGAARNAVDCALWDIEAKVTGTRAYNAICKKPPVALQTAFTISLGSAQEMANRARQHSDCPVLKIKVGTEDDEARIRAVAANAPDSILIIDANEGWTPDNIRHHMLVAAECRARIIEQPLPAGHDDILSEIPHPVAVCADESLHTTDDLAKLAGKYDAINIKLDKTGGLTAALELREEARKQGFGVMVGCMVGTSLSMAPAVLLAQEADFVDLDGPLLLAEDRNPGLKYEGSLVNAPEPELWG